jgi:hypothetical protein
MPWPTFTGTLGSAPAAPNSRVLPGTPAFVGIRGTDGDFWFRSGPDYLTLGGWTKSPVPATFGGAPAIIESGGVKTVFVRSTTNTLFSNTITGPDRFGAWTQVAPDLIDSSPAAGLMPDGSVWVVARDQLSRLLAFHRPAGATTFNTPLTIGGPFKGDPGFFAGPGTPMAFAVGFDSVPVAMTLTGTTFGPPAAMGGPVNSAVVAAASPGPTILYAIGTDSRVQWSSFAGSFSGMWQPVPDSPIVTAGLAAVVDLTRDSGGGLRPSTPSVLCSNFSGALVVGDVWPL